MSRMDKEEFRMTQLLAILLLPLLVCSAGPSASADSPENWRVAIGPSEADIGGAVMGARHDFHYWDRDGWDGQQPNDPYVKYGPGVAVQLWRDNGPYWAGPTGFYYYDYESLIPAGSTKTWWGLSLWAQGYSPALAGVNRVWVGIGPPSLIPPQGYLGHLVLDYVPADLSWTGPWDFWIDIAGIGLNVTLPCPTTDDPYNPENVVRMHLTVYAPPVPEPGSLGGLAGLSLLTGSALVRKRKRAE